MKKMLIFAFLFTLSSFAALAQQQDPMLQKLPVDPNVRMGVLPNGMKYYIYKNEKPQGLADFYILHNVGALEEEDHQNGLAHFLEHMAFNGTKKLPGKTLLDYFQANGVEFGRDINAMTGMDNTQYLISNVPVKRREGIIDTAIMAIADWSGGVALKHPEIDAERGVILEEKRTGLNAGRRMMEQYIPVLFKDSKYAIRNVIGTEEVLKNFKYSDIEDFYHKWYLPDQQAVVIVGDIDVDVIEAKVKKVMGAIPAAKVPTPKVYHEIPAYKEDVVCITKDKEHSSTGAMAVGITNLFPKEHNDTPKALVVSFATSILSSVFNERMGDLSKDIDAKFLGASMGYSSLGAITDAIMFNVASREGQLPAAMEAMATEINRLKKYGITDDEFERVQKNYLESIQTAYDNRADRKNNSIVNMLVANYFENHAMLAPEISYQLTKQILEQLNATAINQFIPMIMPELKMSFIVTVPDKEGAIPTEESILNSYRLGMAANVEAPKVEKIDRPLIEKDPKSVKIKKESKDKMGNTVWTLKNGAKVVVKKTDIRQDEIIFSAVGDGGENMFADTQMIGAEILPSVIALSGLGTFTSSELQKVLAGKNVSFSKKIGSYSHSISGSSSIKDIETAMQLLYLGYTAQPLRQQELDLVNKKLESALENMENHPDFKFQVAAKNILYGNNPRLEALTLKNYKNTNIKEIKTLHDKLFDGVGNMTFVFVGSIDESTLKPLVEKYIASIPAGGKKHKNATSAKLVKGEVNEKIAIELETPKVTSTCMFYTDDIKSVNIKNSIIMSLLKSILDVKYTKSIREEMGATYGVGVGTSVTRDPEVRFILNVSYDTNEKQADETIEQVEKEIRDIASGVSSISEELEIARGAMEKNYHKGIETSNGAWLSYISNLHRTGENYVEDYLSTLKSINTKDIQEIADILMKSGNQIIIQRIPKK